MIFHLISILLRYVKNIPTSPFFPIYECHFENFYSLCHYHDFDKFNDTSNVKNCPAVCSVERAKEMDIQTHTHKITQKRITFLLTHSGK